MIRYFKRNDSPDQNIAGRSYNIAKSLLGSDLSSTFAELRIVNLSRTKVSVDETSTLSLSLAAAAITCELSIQPYEVQHFAALIMARGGVAEMATGEGKTVAVAMAAAAIAATGRSVHVATANDYLAARDHRLMQPVFRRLGIECGLVEHSSPASRKKSAYQCDITYGTADTFAFDYLSDSLKSRERSKQPLGSNKTLQFDRDSFCNRRHAMVIDEIDHILIDEAITPLILSTPNDNSSIVSTEAYADAQSLAERLENILDWTIDKVTRRSQLTERGIAKALQLTPQSPLTRPWTEYVRRAIDATQTLRRNIDYVIQDHSIVIIDAATGRLADGRQWQDGLYQAVQQHEGLPVTPEPVNAAQVTRWRFMRLYKQLCGCSGTALDCRTELQRVYGLSTYRVEPRLPSKRITLQPCFTGTSVEKWERIVDEVAVVHASGRPVLIGTRTVAESRMLASELALRGLSSRVLNGTQDEDEAVVVARAGEPDAITVATDMAGRGTDILLNDEVAARGGLHVIVTEPRHSSRLDRQLTGRCARQGQPGSSRTFVTADDSLLCQHGRGLSRYLARKLNPRSATEPLWNAVSKAAKKSEAEMANARIQLAKRDQQRENFISQSIVSREPKT